MSGFFLYFVILDLIVSRCFLAVVGAVMFFVDCFRKLTATNQAWIREL